MKFERKNVAVVLLCVLALSAYGIYFSNRAIPRTFVGTVPVGGLTRDQAAAHLQAAVDHLEREGITLQVDGHPETISPGAIGLDLNLTAAVDAAFARGRQQSLTGRLATHIGALWSGAHLKAPVMFDSAALDAQLTEAVAPHQTPRRDVRLSVHGSQVSVLTDTAPGRIVDLQALSRQLTRVFEELAPATIAVSLVDDPPRADPASGHAAVVQAQRMLARPMLVSYEDAQFSISQDRIGTWIISAYDGDQLRADIDRVKVGQYVTRIAKILNVEPQPPRVITTNGHVTGFTPPTVGRTVQEDTLVAMLVDTLTARAASKRSTDSMTVPLKVTKLAITGLGSSSGITELIGKATTTFTGSPKNRISNIKNGVKFLTGTMVEPGGEFSALKTLGTIDNTTGYLPELVIKGDRTTPEFGGGLCQVSTTLFRAVMDAGLPVTARRNHSYRVSYYEKDGSGTFIGPGLDATIYDPDVDFRFRNDTAHPVLVLGYVIGDKVTFELYGTRDGRTSAIIGPKLLTETPPGDAIYTQSTEVAVGVTKQVETPHPGGSTVATYVVTYPDGHKNTQEFRSWYRRWPAQYLVGVTALSATPPPAP